MHPTPINPDSALAKEFWLNGKSDTCPIYNMHGHMGNWPSIHFPRCAPEQMIRSMDETGVKMLLFAHHDSLFSPDVGNSSAVEAVKAYPDRFRAYCSINPHYSENIERDLREYDDEIFAGLKMLADYHRVPLTDDRYRMAWEFADEHSLLVLLHTWGGSGYDGPQVVREIAVRHRRARLLLGHSFRDDWNSAISMVREFDNVWLELTSLLGLNGVIELLVEAVGSERILFGTDLPWFDQHHAVGALLSADITDDDRHNIMHRNARKLLKLEP